MHAHRFLKVNPPLGRAISGAGFPGRGAQGVQICNKLRDLPSDAIRSEITAFTAFWSALGRSLKCIFPGRHQFWPVFRVEGNVVRKPGSLPLGGISRNWLENSRIHRELAETGSKTPELAGNSGKLAGKHRKPGEMGGKLAETCRNWVEARGNPRKLAQTSGEHLSPPLLARLCVFRPRFRGFPCFSASFTPGWGRSCVLSLSEIPSKGLA